MSFDLVKHDGKKPWQVAPFNKLTAVQIYYELGSICEGCRLTRAKFLYSTADHQALDLCIGCSNEALEAGAIANAFHLQNYTSLAHHSCVPRSTWHELPTRIARGCNANCAMVGEYPKVCA